MLNRRLLMAQAGATPPGGGIVTDGLIFRLNGLNRGGIQGRWIEEVSGSAFSLSDIHEQENGIEFTGDTRSYAWVDSRIVFAGDNGTFNAAIAPRESWSTGNRIFSPFGQKDGQFSVAPYAGNLIWSNVSREVYPLPVRRGNITLSIDMTKLWINRQVFERLEIADRWSGEDRGIAIGNAIRWSASSTGFRGVIHEIRIYDRILTESEILQNQQYDIDTYFGGVIPE